MDMLSPKASTVQIKSFASRVARRMYAAGDRTTQKEDIEQELWIAWCKAVESFDPTVGVLFKTYLHLGMQRHINRFVVNNVDRRHSEVMALSLDYSPNEGDDDIGNLAEAIPSADPAPSQKIEEESSFAFALQRLSPRAQQFVTFLKEQPEELLGELTRIRAKSDFAKSQGYPSPAPQRVTSMMVFDLMDATRAERTKIISEVSQLGDLVCSRI